MPADDRGDWRPASRGNGCPHDETPDQLAELKRHFPTPRDAVDYIMETFPIVARKDETKHGDYRTKRTILEIYDAMQDAIGTGTSYHTRLDPAPADPACCHPPLEEPLRPASVDPASLPDCAWATPMGQDQFLREVEALAAVLRTCGMPVPRRDVRLAVLLVMEPKLLTPSLGTTESVRWLRLVGQEAVPLADAAWGKALKQLRGMNCLLEDINAGTWGPGPSLNKIQTGTWAEGRARMAVGAIYERGTDALIQSLPEAVREALHAEAA